MKTFEVEIVKFKKGKIHKTDILTGVLAHDEMDAFNSSQTKEAIKQMGGKTFVVTVSGDCDKRIVQFWCGNDIVIPALINKYTPPFIRAKTMGYMNN